MTEKQERFVDAYVGKAKGNATKAAILAGYPKRSARQQGSRVRNTPEVAMEIELRRMPPARARELRWALGPSGVPLEAIRAEIARRQALRARGAVHHGHQPR